jgi:hypothetical protein
MQVCIENGSAVFWLELGSTTETAIECAAAFAAGENLSMVETAAVI